MVLNDACARPLLARDKVRFVGDMVAAVVATTRAAAVDAAELVDVDHDPLDAVVDPEAALADGAPLQFEYDSGDYGRALDEALRLAGYDDLRREQAARRGRGDRVVLGIGLAVYVEVTAGGTVRSTARCASTPTAARRCRWAPRRTARGTRRRSR